MATTIGQALMLTFTLILSHGSELKEKIRPKQCKFQHDWALSLAKSQVQKTS